MDGSSIRGWAAINESDMLADPRSRPPPSWIPFAEIPTLVMYGDIIDPITKQHYERDPRWIAKKAELYLNNSGIADTAYFGAEAEFFIFDNIRFDQNQHSGFYFIDAEEGRWNSGRKENNLGYRPRYKEGYFPVPPTDHYQDLRSEMVQTMIKCGLNIECHHHEVATGGQCEIDQRFDTLVKSADNMMMYKYVIRNVANQYGKTVTFMPKPLFARQRQRHAHPPEPVEGRQAAVRGRLLRRAEPDGAVVHRRPAEARARAFAPSSPPPPTATSAWCRATKRRSTWPTRAATVRPPAAFRCTRRAPRPSASSSARRIPSANPYLAFAAMLMAGLDGVLNKIDPGEPLDKDIYDLSPEEMKNVPSMPGSLDEALDCLRRRSRLPAARATSSPKS